MISFEWYTFYSKFPTFTDFEKKIIFFQRTQISYVFEKSYYFDRILRQICYNLLIKNFEK